MNPSLLTLRMCLWNAVFRRPLSLMLFLIGGCVIWMIFSQLNKTIMPSAEETYWEVEYERMRLAAIRKNMDFYVKDNKNLKPIPAEWTAQEKCPACFGVDMCDAIKRGEVLVEIPETETAASKKGVYLGQWNDIPIAVKRLSGWYPTEFKEFDKFMCKNATGSETCSISDVIVSDNSLAQQPAAFEPENILQYWKISYPEHSRLSLAYSLCVSPEVVKMFSDTYDSSTNAAGLSRNNKAMLFTSMVVQPESLMLKFLKGIQFQRVAPYAYGACGRLIVVENGGHLLTSYLDKPFSDRAQLGMQLLGLVQALWHADRHWFVLYRNFDFENFAVSHEKEIFVIDFEELNIIRNFDFDEAKDEDLHEDHDFGENIACNADCFNGVLRNLSAEVIRPVERQSLCKSLHSIAGAMMFSELCRNILSDLDEHKTGSKKYPGLLHSVPLFDGKTQLAQKLTSQLRECVHESAPGKRIEAVNAIANVLSMFMKSR